MARCAQLQRHAEVAAAAADREEAAKSNLKGELEKLRVATEAAEQRRLDDDATRRDKARKKVRDASSDAYHSKEADRSRSATLEVALD
jgi:hypothetical protein